MTIAASMRELRYAGEARSRRQAYSRAVSREQQLEEQLRLWNAQWRRISGQVPYWRQLRSQGRLPAEFQSWDEFREKLPITTRAGLKQQRDVMTSAGRKPDFQRITGGTTAQPVQLPAWNEEKGMTLPDIWVARGWYGVTPAARVFMLWGHSHLLGSGAKGWVRGRMRVLKDRLLGYYRFSAYDLGPQALRRAGEEIIRFAPEYIYGYSVALDLLARANTGLRGRFRKLGVKLVVGAAEGFPAPDSESLLQDLFGCPVAMEYGSVETFLVAHTHPEGGYRVFWRTYLVEAEQDSTEPYAKVRVTSLYPRCFPLVRYEIGDEIELIEPGDRHGEPLVLGITGFKRVLGRCNDYVLLDGGVRIHSEVFTHAVRGVAAVDGYQVVQRGKEVRLLLLLRALLDRATEREIRSALRKVHPLLEGVRVEQVSALQRTVAGKTPMVVRTDA